MFAPHIILALLICKKIQMIIIVDNFTSFVKQHEISSIVFPSFFTDGGLAGMVPASRNLSFAIISDTQNRIICNGEKNRDSAKLCVGWQELHFV